MSDASRAGDEPVTQAPNPAPGSPPITAPRQGHTPWPGSPEAGKEAIPVVPRGQAMRRTSCRERSERGSELLLKPDGQPCALKQGSLHYGLRVKSSPPPVVKNKVLLEHGHTHSFTYRLWQLSHWITYGSVLSWIDPMQSKFN